MTPYVAREYLSRLGEGDAARGLDLALRELEAEGYKFRPGAMPLAPDGQPTCCVLWQLGLEMQIAACHANVEARAIHRKRRAT